MVSMDYYEYLGNSTVSYMYRRKLFKMLSFSYIINIFKNHRNRKGRSFSTVSTFFISNGTSNQLIQKFVSSNLKKGAIANCNCIDALLRRLHYMMTDIFTIFFYLQKRQTYNPAQSLVLSCILGCADIHSAVRIVFITNFY